MTMVNVFTHYVYWLSLFVHFKMSKTPLRKGKEKKKSMARRMTEKVKIGPSTMFITNIELISLSFDFNRTY